MKRICLDFWKELASNLTRVLTVYNLIQYLSPQLELIGLFINFRSRLGYGIPFEVSTGQLFNSNDWKQINAGKKVFIKFFGKLIKQGFIMHSTFNVNRFLHHGGWNYSNMVEKFYIQASVDWAIYLQFKLIRNSGSTNNYLTT